MHRSFALILACTLIAASLGAAQLYRWVDEQGRVEWRDTPPPANAKKVEKRSLGSNTIETSAVPYSLQQAMRNHPVTLWVYDCGEPCNDARAHLARRGIPHNARDPQKDPDVLKKISGGLDVPVLMVGSALLKGYLASDWDAALDRAGYPRTSAAAKALPAKSESRSAAAKSAEPNKGEPQPQGTAAR
jgi:hypothetical protein